MAKKHIILNSKSGNHVSAEYDTASYLLTITYASGVYDYKNVEPSMWENLVDANNDVDQSVGSFISRFIGGGDYEYTQRTPDEESDNTTPASGVSFNDLLGIR